MACQAFERCRVMRLTTKQFMSLGGEEWPHSMRTAVGKEAQRLYVDIFGSAPKQVRSSRKSGHRGRVGLFPCGILEQAYRNVMAKRQVAPLPIEQRGP